MEQGEIFIAALKGRAWEYGVIPVQELVFSPELYRACEANICGNYNKSWSCPPGAGTLESQKRKILRFGKAFVFTTKADLEDSFDYEGMQRAKDIHTRLTFDMHETLGPSYPVYGAGGCTFCETCSFPGAPCRFPEKAVSAIEAAGISVTDLSRSAGVAYNNGPNTVTYFSMVLFEQKLPYDEQKI